MLLIYKRFIIVYLNKENTIELTFNHTPNHTQGNPDNPARTYIVIQFYKLHRCFRFQFLIAVHSVLSKCSN